MEHVLAVRDDAGCLLASRSDGAIVASTKKRQTHLCTGDGESQLESGLCEPQCRLFLPGLDLWMKHVLAVRSAARCLLARRSDGAIVARAKNRRKHLCSGNGESQAQIEVA